MARKEGFKGTELFGRLVRDEEAADAAEYALVVALIALAIVTSAKVLGLDIAGGYTQLTNRFNGAMSGV
jgi:Flp pilus assembly pilin Flp